MFQLNPLSEFLTMWKSRIVNGPCSSCVCPENIDKSTAANRCPYLGPPLDFVYLYVHSATEGEELRYSIRSVFANYLGPARIWVVGDKPDWYQGLHISLPRVQSKHGRARLDRAFKFHQIATAAQEIADRFVAMQDDIYLVNPVTYFDLNRRWVIGYPMTPESVANWNPRKGYLRQKRRTAERLFERGLPEVHDYSTHTPKFYYKEDLRRVIEDFGALHEPLVCTILFDNAIQRKDETCTVRPYRARIKSRNHSANDVLSSCRGKIFLNHVEKAWTVETLAALRSLFPVASPVEQPET